MKKLFVCLLLTVLPVPAWAVLPGPMKDFFAARPGETTAVIYGTRGINPELLQKIEWLARRNASYLQQRDPSRVVQIVADTAFSPWLTTQRSLVIMGSTRSNKLLSEWRQHLPFMIKDARFNIAGRKLYMGEDVTFSCVYPNPLSNNRYIFLLVGNEAWAQPSLTDWEGSYDYYVAQRHSFPGQYLNRGKFDKTSSLWNSSLTEYDRAPGDTIVLVGLIYPHGKIWYPFRWELDNLWRNPVSERMQLLRGVQNLVSFFGENLDLKIKGDINFHFSTDYPRDFGWDPMGRVFVRTRPEEIDSLTIYSWGGPFTRVLIPCEDAPLDWEFFCHRHLYAETFYQLNRLRTQGRPLPENRGREWLNALTEEDSTYLSLFRMVDSRRIKNKIFEALDSVSAGGRNYSFKMKDFLPILARIVPDTAVRTMARQRLIPSPYGRRPTFHLGIKNPEELFANQDVIVEELSYGGKAYTAGLRKGDRILSIDGFPTERNRSRAYLVWLGKKKGETLKLEIMRKGIKHTVLIPVG